MSAKQRSRTALCRQTLSNAVLWVTANSGDVSRRSPAASIMIAISTHPSARPSWTSGTKTPCQYMSLQTLRQRAASKCCGERHAARTAIESDLAARNDWLVSLSMRCSSVKANFTIAPTCPKPAEPEQQSPEISPRRDRRQLVTSATLCRSPQYCASRQQSRYAPPQPQSLDL